MAGETAVPFENVRDRLRTVLEEQKKQEAIGFAVKVRKTAVVQTFLPTEK